MWFDFIQNHFPELLLAVTVVAIVIILLVLPGEKQTQQTAPVQQPTPAPQPAAQTQAQPQVQAATASTPNVSSPSTQPQTQETATADPAGPPVGGPLPSPAQMAAMPLTQLVRVLGLGSVMKVDDTVGMTFGRVFILGLWMAVTAFLLFPLGARIVSIVSNSVVAWYLAGSILWVLAMAMSLHFFLVYVREDTAFIGVDALSGRQHVFLTRLNVKYPSEKVHKRNFIDLSLGEINEKVTYNTSDGARYTYTYLILYRASVKRLPIYRAVKENDIKREVQAIVRSALSIVTLGHTADELSAGGTAAKLEQEVRRHLGQRKDDDGHELEYRFGIDIVNISLSEPTPDQDIIEGKQAIIVAGLLRKAMDKLRGDDKELSAQEAANLAAMLNKEQVTKTVHSYELGNLPAVLERTAGNVADRFIQAMKG